MRVNPFRAVYEKLNSDTLSADALAMPLLIDIELTNACNFDCLFCYTGAKAHHRPLGFMSDEMYHHILEQIIPYQIPLRFIRWGEPTLHKGYIDYLRKAKESHLLCHMNTNGSLLTEEKIQALLDLRLDSLKFSFQGTDAKTYSEMRYGQSYERLVETVQLFHQLRGNLPWPYLHITSTVTYETPEMIQEFTNELLPFVDSIEIGKTNLSHLSSEQTRLPKEAKKMLDELKNRQTINKEYKRCSEVLGKLSINWDGSVTACCGDYDNYMIVGNLHDSSLQEIWNESRELKTYRSMLKRFKHEELPLCKTCYETISLGK